MTSVSYQKVRAEALALPPADEKLERLYQLWNEQRGALPMPDRSALTPEALRFMLGFINLIDATEGPPFRFRLVGTGIAQRRDVEYTGKTTQLLRPLTYRETVERHYTECRTLATPTLYHVYLSDGECTRSYRRLMLPYSDRGTSVALIATGTHFVDRVEDVVRSERFLQD